MYDKRHLLIIGAGILQVPAIQIAREMGIGTIVTDYNAEATGLKLADYPIIMSTKDIEGSVRIARAFNERIRIDGVFTVGTDASTTVAAVAAALNLPGIKYETAEAATNKFKMRKKLSEHNVPCPKFGCAWNYEEAVKLFHQINPPVVVKPTNNMGARGVMRVDKIEDLQQAFYNAKSNSPVGEAIIEEYMEGPELSIDALVYNGNIWITGVADRIISYAPYFVEVGHIMPSNLPTEMIQDAVNVMKSGIKALGIDIGAAKGDIKITKDGAKIGEIAARLSGGFMSAYTYPYSSGVELIKNAIMISLGEPPIDLAPKHQMVSVEKAIIPKPGIIKSIDGIDKALTIDGVKNIFLLVNVGDTIKSPTNNVEKAGNVIVVAKTREEGLKIADEAIKTVQILTDARENITFPEIRATALKRFNKTCYVCKSCDGKECRGQVPGMGGVDTGSTFTNNILALEKYLLNVSYIHNAIDPVIKSNIFGYPIDTPVLISPVSGTDTNMGGGMSERDYTIAVLKGAKKANTLVMVGDGTTYEKHLSRMRCVKEVGGYIAPIFKPRADQNEIIQRIHDAEEAGAIAVGIDIDAINLAVMTNKNIKVEPKDVMKLKQIVKSTSLPFIIKGIMSKIDAVRAIDCGAQAIIVSNHGGRILDHMPGTIDVLPEIVEQVHKDITILIDGGFRNGVDVLKGLSLGAKYVCLGRPVAIGAMGGEEEGVSFIIKKISRELKEAMRVTGQNSVNKISPHILRSK